MSASSALAVVLAAALAAPASAPPVAGQPESAPPAESASDTPGGGPLPAPQPGWEEPAPDAEPQPQPEPAATAEPPPPRLAAQPDTGAPPPPVSDRPASNPDAGKGMIVGGAILTALGGASMLFVALPSAIVKTVALNRARRDPLVAASDRETRYRRARIADDTMEGAFWGGVAAIGVGIPLIIAGVVVRNNARREVAQRLQIDATGVAVRF